MKKYILILLIFTISSNFLFAQEVIFKKTKVRHQTIMYGTDRINNSIITTIAKGNEQSTGSIEIDFSFKLTKKIVQTQTENIIKVLINNIELENHLEYKQFPINEYLFPSKISFNLKYFKNDVQQQIFNYNKINLFEGKIVEEKLLLPEVLEENLEKNPKYSFKIVKLQLFYNENDKKLLDKYVLMINKYYENSNIILNKLSFYDDIIIDEMVLREIDDLNLIFDYRDIATENEDFVLSVKQQDFFKELPLNSIDPEYFINNLTVLQENSIKLKNICNNIINNLDAIYYDRGIVMLSRNDINMAEFYFNKSISYNENFAPAHYQIAQINYNTGNYEKALEIIMNIYKMNPDIQTVRNTNDLAKLIYLEYINTANFYNSKNNFNEALRWLDKASIICRDINAVLCTDDLHYGYETSIIGNYNIILSEVDNFIAKKQLQNAENKLDFAIKFRKENISYLPKNGEIIARSNQIFNEYVYLGNDYNYRKNYNEAISQFYHAQHICNKYNYVTCSQELLDGLFEAQNGIYTGIVDEAEFQYNANNLVEAENLLEQANTHQITYYLNKDSRVDDLFINIKQKRYNNAILEGNKLVQTNNFSLALDKYNFAKGIEGQYNITPNRKLNSYISSTAKSLILQKIENGENKVKQNDLDAARNCYQNAINFQNQYNLINDYKINKNLEALNSKIFQQQCLNYKANYNSQYQNAINLINKKDYLEANQYLTKAINEANIHSECMINVSNAENKRTKIADAVLYQKKMNNVLLAYANQQFTVVIDEYIKLTDYFNHKSIEKKYSLTHLNLYDFIKERSNNFINYSVRYYCNNDELDKAVSLLEILQQRNFKKKYSKANQEILGNKLAIRDFKQNPNLNYKIKVLEYTNGNKWFKYLKKAYKKQIKIMD